MLDFIGAVSGVAIGLSIFWIAAGLFAALVIGTVFASLFLSIFYSASRLATAAERANAESARKLPGKLRAE